MHLVGWGENIVSFLTGREGYVPTLCKKKPNPRHKKFQQTQLFPAVLQIPTQRRQPQQDNT